MRIAIGVPSMDYVPVDFLACLFSVFSYERMTQTVFVNTKSSLVQQSRYMLVEAARKAECDKLLMVDSDHFFPPDSLSRLLEHDKPVVGCTYCRRREPFGLLGYHLDGYPINITDKGLEQVALLPLGFILIDMEVFDKVECPWFCVGFDLEKNLWTGEDYGFCTGVKQHGYEIWCDYELSREIGHIGQCIYNWKWLEERSSAQYLPR